jgi:NADPH-dependent glutamate synthase beta subunit-like oxidoreductase
MYFYPNCVVNISDAPVDLEETEYAVVDKSSKENKGINQICAKSNIGVLWYRSG